jgi:hypothetical protein
MNPFIDAPGCYDIPASTYHSDPVVTPSLSSGMAKTILEQSPRHAWLNSRRLNPAFEPEHRTLFDLGHAAHAVILGAGEEVAIIDAPNYTTKAAQQAKQLAYLEGRTPVLRHQMASVNEMAAAVRAQLDRHEEASEAFVPGLGKAEQALIWQEPNGVWCRALLDWLPNGGNVFHDLKSTGASANPDHWGSRTLYDSGFDVQAAFYCRGIRAVLGVQDPHFRFVVVENEPPYALSVVELTPAAMAMANRKAEEAVAIFGWCQRNNRWPGYPGRVCYVDPPVWAERKWLEREERGRLVNEAGESLLKIAIDWQAPLPRIAPPKEDAA